MLRGWPLGSSGRETEKLTSESAKIFESEGWMNWSISGGACSKTRGQKLGILAMVSARLAKAGFESS